MRRCLHPGNILEFWLPSWKNLRLKTSWKSYVEKLVLDQDYLFSTNPQISADLLKFANVRNWSRMLEIPADLCFC